MKNPLYRVCLAALTLTVLLAMSGVTARAEGEFQYTPVNGGIVTVDQYLVVDSGTSVPSVTFSYTIAPADGFPSEETAGLPMRAGVAGATVTESVSFSTDDTASAESEALGRTIAFATSDSLDECFATKPVTADFSNVTFEDIGVYRYVLTRKASGYAGIAEKEAETRWIDVRVIDDNGKLKVHSCAVWSANDVPTEGSAVKSTGFTASYHTHALTVAKNVVGNQSATDKYFKFTVKLLPPDGTTLGDATQIAVSGDSFDKTPENNGSTKYSSETMSAANNVTEVNCGALNSNNGRAFYLRHGQAVTLSGIPAGVGYEVTEEEEDYLPSASLTGDTDIDAANIAGEYHVKDTELTEDTVITFTNQKEGVLPTGILLSVGAPALALVACVGGAAWVLVRRGKRRHD